MQRGAIRLRFVIPLLLGAAFPSLVTEASPLSCAQCGIWVGCAADCAPGASGQTVQVMRCDGKRDPPLACLCYVRDMPPDTCSPWCAAQTAIEHDGCAGYASGIVPDPSQPQCSCAADCDAPSCDDPQVATCGQKDVKPSQAGEDCGDGKDNDCNGEIDDGCEVPDKRPEQADGVCGIQQAEASKGADTAGADPIHLWTRSAVTEPFTDFGVEGIVKLSLTRTYSSADISVRKQAQGGIFGHGWHHDWEMELTCADAYHCNVTRGSGQAMRFSRLTPPVGHGITTSAAAGGSSTRGNVIPPVQALPTYPGESWVVLYDYDRLSLDFGEQHVLVRRPDGEYILYDAQGREYHFQADCAHDYCSANDNFCADPAAGGRAHLVRMVDPNGNAVVVDHDRPSGILLSLTDPSGHRLELRASGNACSNGLVRSLTYDGATYLTYEYGGDGRQLEAVRVSSADGRGPVLRGYEYGYPGNPGYGFLSRIRNEAGDPIVEFGYDSEGDAISVVDAESTVTVT